MAGDWHKWSELAPWEQRFLIKAAVLLPWMWILVRFRNPSSLIRTSTTKRQAIKGIVPAQWSDAVRCATLTNIAAKRLLPINSCLAQALVLRKMLRDRMGLIADIKIGTTTAGGQFTAHAWVEVHGKSLDLASGHYTHVFSPNKDDS